MASFNNRGNRPIGERGQQSNVVFDISAEDGEHRGDDVLLGRRQTRVGRRSHETDGVDVVDFSFLMNQEPADHFGDLLVSAQTFSVAEAGSVDDGQSVRDLHTFRVVDRVRRDATRLTLGLAAALLILDYFEAERIVPLDAHYVVDHGVHQSALTGTGGAHQQNGLVHHRVVGLADVKPPERLHLTPCFTAFQMINRWLALIVQRAVSYKGFR